MVRGIAVPVDPPNLQTRVDIALARSQALVARQNTLRAQVEEGVRLMQRTLAGLRSYLEVPSPEPLAPVRPSSSPDDSPPRRKYRFVSAAADLQGLAEEFSRTRSASVREAVAAACNDWASALARGVARRSTAEAEDLAQVAALAVLRALDRYNPEVGPFEPYARATVAGEVRHYLRATEWSLRVPRRYQEAYRQLARTREELTAAGLPEPSLEQLTRAAGLEADDVRSAAGLRRRTHSLDASELGHRGDRWLAQRDHRLEGTAERADLQAALEALDAAGRQVVGLYFFGDLTQREVAEALGTNQVRVSRLLRQCLDALRGRLTEYAS